MTNHNRVTTPYDQLTYSIIGCAMSVHRNLGPGLRENTYQRDLENQLTDRGIPFESQKLYEVFDTTIPDGLLGYYIPDFVIDGKIIVEIKALPAINQSHVAQVIGYLAVCRCPVGLLLNFGQRSLIYHRIFPPENITDHHVNRQWLFIPDTLKPK